MNSIETINQRNCFTRSYWCHICKQEFTRIVMQYIEIKCVNCNSTFCEELNIENANDHPSNFRAFNINHSK